MRPRPDHREPTKARLTRPEKVTPADAWAVGHLVDTAAEERRPHRGSGSTRRPRRLGGLRRPPERTWIDEADEDDNLTRGL